MPKHKNNPLLSSYLPPTNQSNVQEFSPEILEDNDGDAEVKLFDGVVSFPT